MAQDLSIKVAPARDHMRAGRFEQAAAVLQRVNQQHPGQGAVLGMLIVALARSGKGPQAAFYAQQARHLAAGRAGELTDLGNLLGQCGLVDEAMRTYEQVLSAEPGFSPARVGLSGCHFGAYRLADAIEQCREGLRHDPKHLMLRGNLGLALVQSGRAREGVRILREAAADEPDDLDMASALAAATNYAGDVTPEQSMEDHEAYGRLLERRHGMHEGPRASDPEKRLRVGIVSADLRAHPCGTFIEPWLVRHDRSAFEIVAYSVGQEDGASARLRGHVEGWRRAGGLDPRALAEQIRRDGIDVVLELSGHTMGHRLEALHLRPAPVQVTYFGYPNTTGVRAVGARLVDSITDPPGSERLATERLVRLDPCFLCFPPSESAPEVGPLPASNAEPAGAITFGSFNNVAKIDELTIGLWASALRAVPGSRLLLKHYALGQEAVRADLLARFVSAGVEAQRVLLDPPGQGTGQTLRAYQRVDIALDTFPYHGTTTTCEALFMGVPVVTLMGGSCVSRVSGSILSAAGCAEWSARTSEQFAQIAAGLAADAGQLAEVRAGLRRRVLASALCDQAAFVNRLESALRGLWRDACAAR